MQKWIMILLLSFFIGTASAQQKEKEKPADPEVISSEDLKIVAEMETLQLWELAEDQEMMEDMNLLIEDDQNEPKTKETADSDSAGPGDLRGHGR